jgi:hypothetical protein
MKLKLEWVGNPFRSQVVDVATGTILCVKRLTIDVGTEVAAGTVTLCEGPEDRVVPIDLSADMTIECTADVALADRVQKLTD